MFLKPLLLFLSSHMMFRHVGSYAAKKEVNFKSGLYKQGASNCQAKQAKVAQQYTQHASPNICLCMYNP